MKRKIGKAILFLFLLTVALPYLVIAGLFSADPTQPFKTTGNELCGVKVLCAQEDRVRELSMEEYVAGVLAYYLPVDMNEDTYRTLAVLARTYAYYNCRRITGRQKENHPQYDLCDDELCCLGLDFEFLDKGRKAGDSGLSGLSLADFYGKLMRGVQDTQGEVLLYQGQLILPRFFYASWGRTESSSAVLEEHVPYLISVESPENAPAPYGKENKIYEDGRFITIVKSYYPDLALTAKELDEIEILETNKSGSVAKIKVGNKFLTGREFQTCFSLNSSAFSISHEKKNMVITTRGFGDGLGLSLYGAEAMGDANADYGEILQHYFVGTSLEQISAFYHVTETKE